MKKTISKTERILSIYHLLKYCKEVSMKELTDLLPGSNKTFSRDIALLKSAGVQVRFSWRRMAFVLKSRERIEPDPELFEDTAEKRQIEKLLRLMTIMDGMRKQPDPATWYRETFPGVSHRTMQRDFATLNRLGYYIRFQRERNDEIEDYREDESFRRYYCCDWPVGLGDALHLDTFKRVEF